jgi:ribonuclease HI
LHARAKDLIARLEWFAIGHAMREHNQEADQLANEAMDKGMGRSRTPSPNAASGQLSSPQEFEGMVRNGVVDLQGKIPDGTRVQVRVKK